MKLVLYQIIGIGFIWLGMAFFFDNMQPTSKIIFYCVTSWLLFLIVIYIKQRIKGMKDEKL
ncbi:hypothetical protein CFK37_02380 [Virgibacillus phasianinus]|uniref:Uncharacterized protein n=1 Tax=Virgibacillus phasianinus TaxID=2017483 RepID=A0A220TZB3_9BACI|nr:hypothetical protein [Virgibacillus phasianinus]ASK61120.1 hypothetical protein CFK37_02380 [Virgibacillus phasianinus]